MKTLLILTIFAAGCTAEVARDSRELCIERTIGDPRRPIELEIVSRDRLGSIHGVADHAPAQITLSDGRQGLVLSVRARNLDGCAVAVAMHSPDRAEIRGGTMIQLDLSGEVDPDDPLQFVELPLATPADAITVLIQDATGRWASAAYSP